MSAQKKPKVPRIPLRALIKSGYDDNANLLLAMHARFGNFLRFPFSKRYLIADPTMVQHILLTHKDNYSKDLSEYRLLDLLVGSGLLTSEGKRWQKQRRLLQPLFHLREMPRYFRMSEKVLKQFIAHWHQQCEQGQAVDIVRDMMALSLMFTAHVLLDFDFTVPQAQVMVDKFLYQHVHVCRTSNAYNWLPLPSSFKYKMAKRHTDKAIKQIMRHTHPGRDTVLTKMLEYRDENGKAFTKQDVFDQVQTMLAAGHETTGLGLAWSWYFLAKDPQYQQRILQEVDQHPLPQQYEDLEQFEFCYHVFQESIRLYPPIWTIPRIALQHDEINGHRIKKGSQMLINVYALQRAPQQWRDANEFHPPRFSRAQREKRHKFSYIPFGAGPHVCVANMLALMQARLSLIHLQREFVLTLQDETCQPGLKTYVSLKPADKIMMNLQRRKSKP